MLKVQFESSGCEIQKWMEKGFVGFACFGYKQFKLYIIAFYFVFETKMLLRNHNGIRRVRSDSFYKLLPSAKKTSRSS